MIAAREGRASRALLCAALLCALGFGLPRPATAQTPREQMDQLVQELQKNPADYALRERLVRLAASLNPAPVVPSEAERRMVRGGAAFQGAISIADYREAAREFELAALAAPWYGDAYYNLAIVQDKALDYAAALRSAKLAALASPGNKDAEKLVYAIEFRKEKADAAVAAAAQQTANAALRAQNETALLKSLEGAVFTYPWTADLENQFRISNGVAVFWTRKLRSSVCTCNDTNRCNGPAGEEGRCDFAVPLSGRRGELRFANGVAVIEVADDGQSLSMKEISSSGTRAYTYKRR